jgi:hypothetical protein
MNFNRTSKSLAACGMVVVLLLVSAWADEPAKKSVEAPHGQTISVEMIGPVTQTTDLQIICVLKHDPAGDKYIEAIDDFNQKLHQLLSNLRERGEFAGELGETLLFTPPANTITPKRVLLIGIGEESSLSLDRLSLAGVIAARESVRLKASDVSFAPTLRDQGSGRIDVGEGDAAFAHAWVLAYDTEMKLQQQGLAPASSISSLTIEAGPKYFDGAAAKVADAVKAATAETANRTAASYASD